MIVLQYFNGRDWVDCGNFGNEHIAWVSLGGDDFNYRTIDKESGEVLTDKSGFTKVKLKDVDLHKPNSSTTDFRIRFDNGYVVGLTIRSIDTPETIASGLRAIARKIDNME